MAHRSKAHLLQDLRDMWRAADPAPEGLSAKVLAALAVEDLDREYELLHLVETTTDLAGARAGGQANAVARAMTIEFKHDALSVLLRVGTLDDGRRRIDGWIAPACGSSAAICNDRQSWRAAIDEAGRFELASLPPGPVRLWIDGAEQSFTTTMFEL